MKSFILKSTYIALASILFLAIYVSVLDLSDNFHAAIPGELYRSGQLDADDIPYYVKQYNIKSILNLRGPQKPGTKWYDEEIAASAAAGIVHGDFRVSAKRGMDKDSALALIAMMKSMPKPLLIHCKSGSDRTGLAAALYFAGVKKDTEFNSELQLSLLYGHVPLWFTQAYAMNETFELLEPYLGYFDS